MWYNMDKITIYGKLKRAYLNKDIDLVLKISKENIRSLVSLVDNIKEKYQDREIIIVLYPLERQPSIVKPLDKLIKEIEYTHSNKKAYHQARKLIEATRNEV